MNLKYSWEIDGQKTEWYERTVLEEEMDQEENWAKINITKDFGVNPIVVEAGQSVHILVQAQDGCENNRYEVWVGDQGYPNDIEKIEGQEIEFETRTSTHDNNNTR